jgi:hypothetical protein
VISTILVPTSGTPQDTSVFQTALLVAKPLSAHIEFYHLGFSPYEALVRTPHADFCVGNPATASAVTHAKHREDVLSAEAGDHFKAFCLTNHIEISVAPSGFKGMTAHYLRETGWSTA